MIESRKAGVVIPAYNEAANLPEVLRSICHSQLMEQIVVVDDGSNDGTLAVVEAFAACDSRLEGVRLEVNLGKGGALLAGVTHLHDDVDYVIFVDADLVGIQPAHMEVILEPVVSGEAEMVVAIFTHGKFHTDIAQQFNPLLNGQRCLKRRAALEALSTLEDSGYGVEVGLEIFALKNHWRVKRIGWEGVWQVVKEEKMGVRGGLRARSQMWSEILKTLMHQGNVKTGGAGSAEVEGSPLAGDDP